MASQKTTYAVYTYNADGQISPVEEPKVILRMRRLTRANRRQWGEYRGVITTYTYSLEKLKRTE